MPEEGMTPNLKECVGVKPLFVDLQICEKFRIDPLRYLLGDNASWQSDKGRALKTVLFAFQQLNAEEEKRRLDEIDRQSKNTGKGGRRK